MNRLAKILDHKRIELAERMQAMPLASLREMAEKAEMPLDFYKALKCPVGERPRLIAEVKCASPSHGAPIHSAFHSDLLSNPIRQKAG